MGDIELNNKSFLLLDSLVSLIMLTSFIVFFSVTIQLVIKQRYYQNIEFIALTSFRESMYSKAINDEYISYENENYYSYYNKKEYCIKYKQGETYEEICK